MVTMMRQRPTEIRVTAEKCMEYGAAAYGRRADQTTAAYNPLGGTGERACANCLFFISPNACTVVEDYPVPISPTGLSQFWTAIPAPSMGQPIPVVIVESEVGERAGDTAVKIDGGLLARVVGAVKAAFGSSVVVVDAGEERPQPEGETGLRFYKDAASGALRWFGWVSNKYRDAQGEIIMDAAHREYVDYLDRTKDYPELLTWHTKGTRYGVADWAEYSDGFLTMSGPVDPRPEAQRAVAALKGKALGMSHGFLQAYADKAKGLIGWYRSFEVSSLPRAAAANAFTGFSVPVQEEVGMGFRADKRAHLVEVWGEERVSALEKDTATLSAAVQKSGLDFKDIWEEPAGAAATGGTGTVINNVMPSAKEIGEAASAALMEAPAFKALGDGLAAVNARLDAQDVKLKALERSDDDKIADAFKARTSGAGSGAGGYRASQAGDTVLGDKDAADAALKQAAPIVDPKFMAALRGQS